jgi:hypothetical protein
VEEESKPLFKEFGCHTVIPHPHLSVKAPVSAPLAGPQGKSLEQTGFVVALKCKCKHLFGFAQKAKVIPPVDEYLACGGKHRLPPSPHRLCGLISPRFNIEFQGCKTPMREVSP